MDGTGDHHVKQSKPGSKKKNVSYVEVRPKR
jgi:hypothetical protein